MADLFDVVVARKLSGGGGGGSSDFSTAQVTFESTNGEYTVAITSITNDELWNTSYMSVSHTDGPLTITVPLYKGSYMLDIESFKQLRDFPICTGDVVLDNELFAIVITGDGTFTAAGISMN